MLNVWILQTLLEYMSFDTYNIFSQTCKSYLAVCKQFKNKQIKDVTNSLTLVLNQAKNNDIYDFNIRYSFERLLCTVKSMKDVEAVIQKIPNANIFILLQYVDLYTVHYWNPNMLLSYAFYMNIYNMLDMYYEEGIYYNLHLYALTVYCQLSNKSILDFPDSKVNDMEKIIIAFCMNNTDAYNSIDYIPFNLNLIDACYSFLHSNDKYCAKLYNFMCFVITEDNTINYIICHPQCAEIYMDIVTKILNNDFLNSMLYWKVFTYMFISLDIRLPVSQMVILNVLQLFTNKSHYLNNNKLMIDTTSSTIHNALLKVSSISFRRTCLQYILNIIPLWQNEDYKFLHKLLH